MRRTIFLCSTFSEGYTALPSRHGVAPSVIVRGSAESELVKPVIAVGQPMITPAP
jgi:hypothetical protein